MEQQKSVVVRQTATPAFVDNAMQSIENMMQYANTLLASGLCPAHFYEQDDKRKPILSKGKPAAVVMVLQHGFEVGLSPMQALQQVIPVNGLISIKGDGAKSLIFGSGVLYPNSWIEQESGTIKDENYTFSITAKRKDNGMELTRSFSVDDAKRAGLWITEKQLDGNDAWKYKKSAWYKYPDRMVRYRCLGFISRDLFSDVLAGMYTAEEAQDLPQDTEMIIPTPGGATISIPDKEFSQERSQNLTSKASNLIDKKNQGQSGEMKVEEAKEHIESERLPKTEEEREKVDNVNADVRQYPATQEESVKNPVYTEDQLKEMKVAEMRPILQSSPKMVLAVKQSDRQNTNKKYREIILAFQDGKIDEWIDSELKRMAGGQASAPENKDETPPSDENEIPMETIEGNEDVNEDMGVNTDFENQGEEAVDLPASNNKNIEVPEFAEGKEERSYDDKVQLFNDLLNIGGVNAEVFQGVVRRLPQLQKYNNKEDFSSKATVGEVNLLINSVE